MLRVFSVTLSYNRYEGNHSVAIADNCNLCRNTIFIEYGEFIQRLHKDHRQGHHWRPNRYGGGSYALTINLNESNYWVLAEFEFANEKLSKDISERVHFKTTKHNPIGSDIGIWNFSYSLNDFTCSFYLFLHIIVLSTYGFFDNFQSTESDFRFGYVDIAFMIYNKRHAWNTFTKSVCENN